jgi:hypothetical protein
MLCRMWTARFSPDELRVGNDHLGQTRAFPTSSPYLLAMFLAGLLLFSLAAIRQYRRRSPTPLAANEHLLHLNS